MDGNMLTALAWLMAVFSGLMAGIYFSFSSFLMRAFATMGTGGAVAAMNAVNVTIVRSSFIALFFGSTLVAVLLALVGLWQWGEIRSYLAFAGGLTYVVGMFAITVAVNVPLNNRLAAVGGGDRVSEKIWTVYLERWTRWNTVRTIASVATLVLCIALLND